MFGVDQSPWVQGVWCCLSHKNIDVELTCRLPRFSWIISNGITIPVLEDNEKYICDSFKIYEYINQNIIDLDLGDNGSNRISHYQKDLENLFFKYSLGRCGFGKGLKFFRAWAGMRDSDPSLISDFYRSFMSFYFFFLIWLGRFFLSLRGFKPYELQAVKNELMKWEGRLNDTNFFSGSDAGVLDYAFFGHVECMASGPTDEMLDIFVEYPNLMAWLTNMHTIIPNYGPMYSKRILKEQEFNFNRDTGFYWPSFFCLVVIFPITILGIFILLALRFRGNHFSGAKL